MIAVDSVSYPYLAVAQHHGVPYHDVLAFVDVIEAKGTAPAIMSAWRGATFQAWQNEQTRRDAMLNPEKYK